MGDSLSSSQASSRVSCKYLPLLLVFSNLPFTIHILTNWETATRRSTRLAADAPPEIHNKSGPSTLNGDDVSTSDFPSPSMIGEYTSAKKATKSRDSLSSVSTTHEYNESSGYSTPVTSAAPTPAPAKSSAPKTRRGRRPTTMLTAATTPTVNAVARAAALRNSKYALNSSSNKRKRVILPEDDDEGEDADIDITADAQLARALQEQEDTAAASMTAMDTDDYSPRRTPRKVKKILPKVDFASDFDEGDIDFGFVRSSKKLKIELGSKGSNAVKFTSSKKPQVILGSDDSDGFVEIDDSEDSDVPIAMSTPRTRMKQVVQAQSKAFTDGPSSTRPNSFEVPARPSKPAQSFSKSGPSALKREDTKASASSSGLTSIGTPAITESEFDSDEVIYSDEWDSDASSDDETGDRALVPARVERRSRRQVRQDIALMEERTNRRGRMERARLEAHHPELHTMWQDLENLPKIGDVKIEQPKNISRELKPFQLEGVAWMKAMEETEWAGGLLGDEMGMGKTIQAVSLIMSDWPAKQPSLVLIPPVALMQWQQEISDYTDGTLRTFVFHGTNAQTKGITVKELKKYDVILMSYNSLESMYRKQEKGFKRRNGIHKEESTIHQIHFHRVILDEAHNIKVRRWFPTFDWQLIIT